MYVYLYTYIIITIGVIIYIYIHKGFYIHSAVEDYLDLCIFECGYGSLQQAHSQWKKDESDPLIERTTDGGELHLAVRDVPKTRGIKGRACKRAITGTQVIEGSDALAHANKRLAVTTGFDRRGFGKLGGAFQPGAASGSAVVAQENNTDLAIEAMETNELNLKIQAAQVDPQEEINALCEASLVPGAAASATADTVDTAATSRTNHITIKQLHSYSPHDVGQVST